MDIIATILTALRVSRDAGPLIERLRLEAPRLRDAVERAEFAETFEGDIDILESACRAELSGDGGPVLMCVDDEDDQEVVRQYASEILDAIETVRSHLSSGEHSKAPKAAMRIERLLTDLDHEIQERQTKRAAANRGRRSTKLLPDLVTLVEQLVAANPEANARELWHEIPEAEHAGDDPTFYRDGKEIRIYRDGDKVVVVAIDRDGATERARSYNTFRSSYVPRAREKVSGPLVP